MRALVLSVCIGSGRDLERFSLNVKRSIEL